MNIAIEARNGALGIVDGHITADLALCDVVIRIPDGDLQPGLINAHDHLHRNHYGRLGHPPYNNSYEWGRDIHERDHVAIDLGRARPRREALLAGAWKNLRCGVTTVVHHDPWEPDFDDAFPIRVIHTRHAHSIGFEPALTEAHGSGPFFIHLAEGVTKAAADEIRTLRDLGLLNEKLCAIHVVGADSEGIELLRNSGAAMVWCPSSNFFLFGRTAPAQLFDAGIDVMLGSDSLLTAEGDLLDEIRVAKRTGLIDDARLLASVTTIPARRLGLPMPSLDVGASADVIVLRKPLGEASAADVAVVICDGQLRVLDPELAPQLGSSASHFASQQHPRALRVNSA